MYTELSHQLAFVILLFKFRVYVLVDVFFALKLLLLLLVLFFFAIVIVWLAQVIVLLILIELFVDAARILYVVCVF